jgi:xanthine/CO dehydrogenase XdhC/CoxF family maturation factor
MTSEEKAIRDAVLRAQEAGRPCALATVVATRGSTPRKNGAKMLVDLKAGLTGTVGGGCGEAEVIRAAEEVISSGEHRTVQVDLTDDPLAWTGSVCGGTLEIFVEPVPVEPSQS